ncbi:uncharacterized protein L201_003766 [Kwoniella dendrophila CBS 6074]|uniref:MutL C-terminal dimerisation domain-containing protein n=1 Tax=Kwoniella dendrophila CBS 6074 TaxID=1295534 RepID=A0AAX4JUJ0_9TREE
MGSITPLPTPTSTAIRSSLIIPTFPQILSEILQNSLDAGAKTLDIIISLVKGNESIRVKDDGCGIGQEGLKRVGKRYRTSKNLNESNLGSVGSYGFRGEALSSITQLSLLTITSRSSPSEEAYTKILKSSKTLYFGIDPSRSISSETGTIITVKEIFHNIPVRKEELSKYNEETLMRQCKKIIEVFALGRPGIKWMIWEEKGYGDKRIALDIPQCKSSVRLFRSLYGNALVHRVQNIRVSAGTKRVEGFISLSGDITKSHQHLYINNYPITRSDLHLSIAKKFTNSRFGNFASTGEHDDAENANIDRRISPRRLERHPIYVLNVILPAEEVDVSFEPTKGTLGYKDFGKVQALLLAVVDEYLKKNGYDRVKAHSNSPNRIHNNTSTDISPSHALHGPSPLGKQLTSRTAIEARWDLTRPLPLTFSGIKPTATILTPTRNTEDLAAPASPHLDVLPPTPPLTPFENLLARKKEISATLVNQASRIATKSSQTSKWIMDLQKSVDTGILPTKRVTSPLKRSFGTMNVESENCQNCANFEDRVVDPLSARPIALEKEQEKPKTSIQLTKASLGHSEIVGQVDKKYISVVLPASNVEKAVVLIDQHAADERISVENILYALCSGFRKNNIAQTKLSRNPPTIILTALEAKQLAMPGVLNVFRRWGISLDLPVSEGIEGDYVQIEIKAVPTLLLGRLGKKEGVEMTRLIRGYLPVLVEELSGIQTLINSYDRQIDNGHEFEDPAGNNEEQNDEQNYNREWGKETRFMPKEMLELVNSKACRGAIMFQDPLDIDQQSRLVDQLAHAKFPFMCAHGRPSMIPLIAIKKLTVTESNVGKRNIDWQAWKSNMDK